MDVGIPRWVDRYQGIPFVEKGSSREGCNCWGLCALVFSDRAKIELNRYREVTSENIGRTALSFYHAARDSKTWAYVDLSGVRTFDIVLMTSTVELKGKAHKIPNHVGIMVSGTHMLHIEKGLNAACVQLDHFSIARRLKSFHRHVSQA